MRIVKMKDGVSTIHGSVLTLFIHKQAFGKDFLDDVNNGFAFDEIINHPSALRVFWSLAKTANIDLIDYDQWVSLTASPSVWKNQVLKEIENSILTKSGKKEQVRDDVNYEPSPDIAWMIVASAKKMGFSLDELNLLSLDSFINIQELYFGIKEAEPREATQEDIDKFLM